MSKNTAQFVCVALVLLIVLIAAVGISRSVKQRETESEVVVQATPTPKPSVAPTIPPVPYVGMSEIMIDSTGIGPHAGDVIHNTSPRNGDILKASVYYFYNSSGDLVFSARCLQGKVDSVKDYRSAPIAQPATSTVRPRSTPEPESDPYNAKDFSYADDFYDEYYDDFFDYYDAEDYWYEHQDD